MGAPPNLKVFSYYTGSGAPLTLATASAINPASNPGVVYGSASPTDHQPSVTYSWNLAVARVLPAAVHVEASYVANTTAIPTDTARSTSCHSAPRPPTTTAAPTSAANHYQQLNRPYQNLRRHRRQRPQPQLQLQLPPVHRLAVQGLVHRLAYLHLRQGPRLQTAKTLSTSTTATTPLLPTGWPALNVSYYLILPHVSQKYFGNSKIGNGVLDGWKISGIEQYGSGSPFTDIAQNGVLHNEYGGNQVIGIHGSYPVPAGTTAKGASCGATTVNIRYMGFAALNAAPTNASTAGYTSTRSGDRTFQFAAK